MKETRLQAGAARDDFATTPEQVAAYLTKNPDFLHNHSDLMESLSPPDRSTDGAVVDLQKVMVEKLRGEVDSLRDCAQSLIETSRENLLLQSRTHSAVIALLSTADAREGGEIVVNDLAAMLNLDAAAIGFEQGAIDDCNIRALPDGCVDHMLGEHGEIRLVPEAADDGTVFGDNAEKVKSCALVRLHVYDAEGVALAPGVLALGSSEAGLFQPEQGTDLITFLARALEKCAGKWTPRA